jgi:hypothetical protein
VHNSYLPDHAYKQPQEEIHASVAVGDHPYSDFFTNLFAKVILDGAEFGARYTDCLAQEGSFPLKLLGCGIRGKLHKWKELEISRAKSEQVLLRITPQ